MSAEFEFRYQGIFQDWRMSSYMITGGFFEHDRNILRLHDACMRRGLGFYIDALFGGQPCAWHAGRIVRKVMDDAALERHMHEYLDAYTERGIAVRLTMSNRILRRRNCGTRVPTSCWTSLPNTTPDADCHGAHPVLRYPA